MDPNANLAEQRETVTKIIEVLDRDRPNPVRLTLLANRLTELVTAMDEWLAGGGFLPDAWARGRHPAPRTPRPDEMFLVDL